MKTNFKYLILGLIAISFFSCDPDEFLDEKDPDALTTDAFWRNADDVEAGIAATYSRVSGGEWGHTEVKVVVENYRSDFCDPGIDGRRYADWNAISTFNITDANSQTTSYWDRNYRGIYFANQVIEAVEGMDGDQITADERTRAIAEMKFIRAFLHFRLLNNWEQIVLAVKVPKGQDELDIPLSSRAEAFAQIQQDLRDAAAGLPVTWDADNTGRASRGAALGYLGKALLHEGKWSEAATELRKVIDLGVYDLVPNFLSLFDGTNENSVESIFEIQFSNLRTNGNRIVTFSNHFMSAEELGGWSDIAPTDALLTEMKSEGRRTSDNRFDERLYQTLYFDDPDVEVFGEPYADVFPTGRTAWRKFISSEKKVADMGWEESQSTINWTEMRYSDILLMYAEALNENGQTAESIPFINQVRARAMMPALTVSSQGDVRNAIVHERAMEFALEGIRFYDLRRWDMLNDKIPNSGKEGAGNFSLAKDSYLPIPEVEKNNNAAIGTN
ncbi:RagB/SusD family nutrient uptake outer membrane protein [Fulvivirgaceae bacterium BMA10]|uniref:RagB/SusD family nutrient uptake outer membrane protein n=1 Tax=Splendidivirga corallicola TaxID=3051826 RepID=A0ABT8KGT4_9BACT|nr:RagB/SusD family nutrient uptake outer membrane protein [Fulvivirgaceae bacterium BMA10]